MSVGMTMACTPAPMTPAASKHTIRNGRTFTATLRGIAQFWEAATCTGKPIAMAFFTAIGRAIRTGKSILSEAFFIVNLRTRD